MLLGGRVLVFFFPTTVVLVDDDFIFLDYLKKHISGLPVNCKTFSNGVEALEFIRESSENDILDISDFCVPRNKEVGNRAVFPSIDWVHEKICSPNRFQKISVVISDYQMPYMDGVSFLSKIQDRKIQKILLTGFAENNAGIEALNSGDISCFLTKNLLSDVKKMINEYTQRYFRIYSDFIFNAVIGEKKIFQKDVFFSDFFNEIYSQSGCVEYYLIDESGSFLMLTEDGCVKTLNVISETEISRLIDVAMASGEADGDCLKKLRSRKYMLACHEKVPVSEWGKCLRPSEVIECTERYYYSFCENENLSWKNEIVSFAAYKKRE